MIAELGEDTAKLALVVSGVYFAIAAYARQNKRAWSDPIEKRRVAILLALALASLAMKVAEDVISGEAGPIDRTVLLFIRRVFPRDLTGLLEVITYRVLARVLVPLSAIATIVLFVVRRRSEAALLAISVIVGSLLVYLVKVAVGRTRPSLWNTDLYWGSSFPNGHTLVVAAFSTALALSVGRAWPRVRTGALLLAFVWVMLVAMSRLVLGVHWPSDVLAAACVGACLPLAFDVALEVSGNWSERRSA